MTELLLIRHGETDFNRALRFQGHVDVPLNVQGRAQAERLAERLRDEPIDGLVSSDLRRARETAEPLLRQRPGLALATDAAWREQGFGVIEGLTAQEIRQQHPPLWQSWLRHDPDDAPPGGESARDFHARVWRALSALASAYAGRRVVVVTHGGVLDRIWRGVHALPLGGPRACDIPNTGLNRLQWQDGRAAVLRWADADHLAGLAQPVVIPRPPALEPPP